MQQAAVGFVTLLLLPFLGVLGLFRKRALPWLAAFTVLWGVLGWIALGALDPHDAARAQWFRAWRIGLALGAAFFAVAWVARRPRIARTLKFAFAITSLVVFLRALYLFVNAYA